LMVTQRNLRRRGWFACEGGESGCRRLLALSGNSGALDVKSLNLLRVNEIACCLTDQSGLNVGESMSWEPFSAVDVIRAKRDGQRLAGEQIDWVVDAYTRGVVADEQMSALAMAILLNGMDIGETARWTRAMIDSGERLDFSAGNASGRPTVDKHSTGGVGDKITLPLAPLVAACGAAVPQLSGRGLGHTGGTLDKLESIPGWHAQLSTVEIATQLADIGAVVAAATEGLAPADRKLYALRDVTGTVESIPLIASSIMSKKIAEGAGSLVLDVKVGSGAFMKTEAHARELAATMVEIGREHGVRVAALLTNMSTPLGRAVGNAVEVAESVEVLRGGGPSDVVELTVALAREMLSLAGLSTVDTPDPAAVLASGAAYETWCRMIRAQGGDPDAILPTARHVHIVEAPTDGVLRRMDAYPVGLAAWRLGAGRARKEDPVQSAAGILCLAKPGEPVRAGTPLLELHTDTPDAVPSALDALRDAIEIGPEAPEPTPLIIDTIR
jgi:thymidine phosphorylase